MAEEVLSKYSENRINLLPMLSETQASEGQISLKAVKQISHHMHISTNDVYSVASFYNDFTFNKSEVKLIEICNCMVCRLQSADQIMEIVQQEMNSKGDVRVRAVYFTSSSICAPVVRINGVFHYKVNILNLKKLLQNL
jgi:NADH-quinone oxidoreductase subunit E